MDKDKIEVKKYLENTQNRRKLEFIAQYQRPDKCNRPTDRGPLSDLPQSVFQLNKNVQLKIKHLSQKKVTPPPKKKNDHYYFFFFGGGGNGQLICFETGNF